jgi:hypothetical protein
VKKTLGFESGKWIAALAIVLLSAVAWAQEFDHNHGVYDAVLKTYVNDGRVNYKALKAAPKALDQYLNTLAAVSDVQFKGWAEPQQIAFLVNLYNASTLRMILDHYPVNSIKDIGSFLRGPWDQPVVRLLGKTITLNNLEHDILRKDYNEPRLHMALVCAAKGCPPLRSEAYTAERLNEQLDDQSRIYLASPAGLRIDRTQGEAHLSAIFKWYGKDFPSVPAFVAKHSGQSIDRLKIRYLDYDWSLNERVTKNED